MKPLIIILLAIFANSSVAFAEGNDSQWPLYIYDFGGYEAFTISEQVSMTKTSGYAGMIVGITPDSLDEFDDYKAEADKTENFDIHAAFYALYNKEGKLVPGWKGVVDSIKGTDINLWLITGRASDKVPESELRTSISNVVSYANKRDVPVSLYPHSNNMIDNAEQAVRMIEELRPLKLDLAFILCHEMRYGNASRIEDVIRNVKDHIGHFVISGSDTNLDDGYQLGSRTLQPLYQGEFDMTRALKELVKIGYNGNMGYINHRFDAAWKLTPSDYLSKSMTTYNNWLENLDSNP